MKPSGCFTVAIVELAAELRLDPMGLRREAEARGMELRKRRGHPIDARLCWCIQPADAASLRLIHAVTRRDPERVEGWYTTAEAARALGLTVRAFYQRRHKGAITVRRVALHGAGIRGRQTRYDPADIHREAARLGIRPTTPPRGTLPTRELGRICGVSRKQIFRWRQAGCPFLLTRDGDAHHVPAQVLAWMEARDMSDRKMNRGRVGFEQARARLAAHLAEQPGRAA